MIKNEDALATGPLREVALSAIQAGITAAHPETVVPAQLTLSGSILSVDGTSYDLDEYDRVVVLGGGNGAGRLATALADLLAARIDSGLVVTDDPTETDTIEMREGTHPLPSEANRDGTADLLERAATLGEDDLVLLAITGGGSALLCHPAEGLSLPEYRELTESLVESGATIDEINAVRKHLSRLKGGRLAAVLAPATVCTLVISDVVGNRLDVIASGPTAPDPTTYDDALGVLSEYDIDVPDAAAEILEAGAAGQRPETPTSGDSAFDAVGTHVLADNRTALDAAAEVCADAGYTPLLLASQIEGEASEVGTVHAGIAAECVDTGAPEAPPATLLSGGEATVTVTGDGEGGPNQEFVLGAGIAANDPEVVVAAVDTDGIDGATDAAGAILDFETIADESEAREHLRRNDAYGYLDDQNALVRTGPTGTNVNDLRLVLVAG